MAKESKEATRTGVSDEQIAAAIITTGSQRGAAQALQISEKTIYNRLSDGNFRAVYENAKAEILRNAVHSLNEKLEKAIETTAEIMEDKDNAPQIRLQAARTIIDSATKLAGTLAKSENGTATQIEINNDPLAAVHL